MLDPSTLTVNDLVGPWPLLVMPELYLIGSKKAVYLNGVLLVSPAMYSLIEGAEDVEELERLAQAIPVVMASPFYVPAAAAVGGDGFA